MTSAGDGNRSGAGNGRHCLVVGAGIVGSCCAWHLVQQGFRVTLLDRMPPGQATSFGNAACVSPSHVVPFSYPGVWKKLPEWLRDPLGPLTIRWKHLPWVGAWLLRYWHAGSERGVHAAAGAQAQLMHRVSDDYRQLLEQTGLTHLLVSRGALAVYDSPQDFAAERWVFDLEAEHGFDYRVLEAGETAELAPALSLPGGIAVMVPSWQHSLDPGAMTAGIAEAAFKEGADWVQGEVKHISCSEGAVTAHLDGGTTLTADSLVVAAGAWSNQLAGALDRTVPMTAKRGYHSMVSNPGIELDLPIISGSRSFVMTPLADGLRLAGTAEFARLDSDPDYRRSEILVKHAQDYFPGIQTSETSDWMGQRPMISDSVPVISRSLQHDNVFYAFGHGHYGLTQGPTTGRLVAALMTGQDPGLNMAPYALGRFS